MMKGKKLIVLLMAVCMMISMSFGMVAEAATTVASTQEQAELMAGKAYTIKKGRSGKWFYQNSKGKTDKKQGWKKDKSGKYAYYVGSKGYVTAKVTGGVYYKWSGKKWKKQSLQKNSTKTICGKAFYVNKNGNISRTAGWKKVSGKYAYYVNGNGAVSVKITGGVYQKWSKTGWKKQSLAKYKGKMVTIQKKAFYVGSDEKINRKTGSIKKPDNEKQDTTSGDTGKQDDPKKDTSSDKQDNKQHVCKWLVVLDKNQNPVQSNYKKHDAVMGTENQLIRDAWDEPIYAEHKWFACNSCSRRGIDDQDCSYETYEELLAHHKAVSHGGNHQVKKIIDYKHHDAEYSDVPVTKERAYEEWDQTYKCTVCGDTMTEHVVCGDTEKKQGVCAFILDKSGELVDDDVIVTANTYYGAYYDAAKDSKYTDYLQLLKDHHFIQ